MQKSLSDSDLKSRMIAYHEENARAMARYSKLPQATKEELFMIVRRREGISHRVTVREMLAVLEN